ncbi:MAG TPA: methyltransferase domain-containing protein [Vicinamibacterales bacterium]|jgi:phosphatidylethanolamine/phosphatidyl-N-methylethanolamine N-methyltransferase|nr:methyltransferase domain-containing protein [Vicinamibacterales bacterium]
MPLFEPRTRDTEEIGGSDAATRALSVTVVDNDFLYRVYENISTFYDFTFGPTLHPGRVDAIRRMGIKPGDRVLEVGVGTGINAALYPRDCSVTGVDLSTSMLEKARRRIARKGVHNVRLLEMDASNLQFRDDSFEFVYAPYVISVVPDPVAVAREMWRVCRPGGRVVILNHFRSRNKVGAWLEYFIAPAAKYLGFKSDLDLPAFLTQADLHPKSIEKVNVPRIWTLITCIKD